MALVHEQLLALLVCPACRAEIAEDPERSALVCSGCRRAYPVRDGIPVMLVEEATILPAPEPGR